MNRETVLSYYGRYAGVYSLFFGPWLDPGRRLGVKSMDCKAGEKVLEIGVGTGLALPLYPKGISVTGIDLSWKMLQQAEQRSKKLGLSSLSLLQMDGCSLDFPDNSFDKSVAMYVASVTPDPAAMVAEMKRVTVPGGRIVLVNHFSVRGSLMALFERAISPLARFIGFEPLFYLDSFLKDTGLEGAAQAEAFPLGYWRVIHTINHKSA